MADLDYKKLNKNQQKMVAIAYEKNLRLGNLGRTTARNLHKAGWLDYGGLKLGEWKLTPAGRAAYEAATAQPTPPPAETPATFVWTGQSSLKVGDWVHIQLTGARHNGFIGEIVVYDDPYYQVLFNDGEYGSFLAVNLIAVEPTPPPAPATPALTPEQEAHAEAYGRGYEVGMKDYARLFAELQAARDQVAGLSEALEPFAQLKHTDGLERMHDMYVVLLKFAPGHRDGTVCITAGEIRRAAAALDAAATEANDD